MKQKVFSIVYMFLITLCFTSIVSAVKYFNDDRIEQNQIVKRQRIVLQVLGIGAFKEMNDQDIVTLFGARIRTVDIEGFQFYIGYEEGKEKPLGYAFPVEGPGFWGPVYGMVALEPDGRKIRGLAFYKHSETPGLGGRIGEPWFTNQFRGLPVFPIGAEKKIFILKPEGTASAPNELDAITGATGTSRAVESFLNSELDRFLKTYQKKLNNKIRKNAQASKS
jgi:Na+-transporting NADH:ubiquinone oxidoreductase subunit C